MFETPIAHDEPTGLPSGPALAELLDAATDDPCVVHLLTFIASTGVLEPLWLAGTPDLAPRLGRLVRHAATSRGGRAFHVGDWTFAAVAPGIDPGCSPAFELAAQLADLPALAGRLVHAEVVVPFEATGSDALKLGLDRLRSRARWHPSSAGRQARDILIELLAERRGGRSEVQRPGVASNALAVGRLLGLGLDALDEVVRAAELQDLGLLSLPDDILLKPARLTAEDWAIVHRHPVIADRALAKAPALAPVARIVRSCYERWDGAGYPDGLHGDAIPLEARVIAVCVAFDAMTSDRPYREALTEGDALAELERCAGRQFDPRVVGCFSGVIAGDRATTGGVA